MASTVDASIPLQAKSFQAPDPMAAMTGAYKAQSMQQESQMNQMKISAMQQEVQDNYITSSTVRNLSPEDRSDPSKVSAAILKAGGSAKSALNMEATFRKADMDKATIKLKQAQSVEAYTKAYNNGLDADKKGIESTLESTHMVQKEGIDTYNAYLKNISGPGMEKDAGAAAKEVMKSHLTSLSNDIQTQLQDPKTSNEAKKYLNHQLQMFQGSLQRLNDPNIPFDKEGTEHGAEVSKDSLAHIKAEKDKAEAAKAGSAAEVEATKAKYGEREAEAKIAKDRAEAWKASQIPTETKQIRVDGKIHEVMVNKTTGATIKDLGEAAPKGQGGYASALIQRSNQNTLRASKETSSQMGSIIGMDNPSTGIFGTHPDAGVKGTAKQFITTDQQKQYNASAITLGKEIAIAESPNRAPSEGQIKAAQDSFTILPDDSLNVARFKVASIARAMKNSVESAIAYSDPDSPSHKELLDEQKKWTSYPDPNQFVAGYKEGSAFKGVKGKTEGGQQYQDKTTASKASEGPGAGFVIQ